MLCGNGNGFEMGLVFRKVCKIDVCYTRFDICEGCVKDNRYSVHTVSPLKRLCAGGTCILTSVKVVLGGRCSVHTFLHLETVLGW